MENEVANSEGGIVRIWKEKWMKEAEKELEEKGFGQRGRHLEGMRWIWKEREGVTDDKKYGW